MEEVGGGLVDEDPPVPHMFPDLFEEEDDEPEMPEHEVAEPEDAHEEAPNGDDVLRSVHGVLAKWGTKIWVKIAFIVAHRCASHNVVFFSCKSSCCECCDCFVNVVIASIAMIGEWCCKCFESAPRSNV